eukprot:574703-Hanusia_phi.AAC.1
MRPGPYRTGPQPEAGPGGSDLVPVLPGHGANPSLLANQGRVILQYVTAVVMMMITAMMIIIPIAKKR